MKLLAGLVVTILVLAAGAYAVIEMNDIDDPATEQPPMTPAPETSTLTPTPTPSPSASCSATALAGSHDHEMAAGLPEAVAEIRIRVIESAIACDYETLEAIALAEGEGFSFSFGGDESPARFWRQREREARRFDEPTSEYMRYLVSILELPYCKESGPDDKVYYVWPRVHCSARTASDWDDLEGLYTDEQIEMMRTGDSYLGFRVGILEDGDWVYFIAGD
jgi:hypothetical protein